MTPLYFVVAILGCGDGSVDCREARIAPARYETMAQCKADLVQQLARNSDVPFPVIGADCRAEGVRFADGAARARRG